MPVIWKWVWRVTAIPRSFTFSIGVNVAIYLKVDTLDAIRVTYEIGPVLSELRGFAKTFV
jgi:hypothetical protein